MASIVWDRELAEVYDKTYRAKFEPSVLGPMVDLLAGLARGGPVLEFAVGTGRVALPLSARGIAVHSTLITSGSRPSMIRPGRSRGRITGSKPTAAWCATPRPTGTSGRPNST